jgi:RpiB/LacA/LacB family sugar-phosphate isomerase
MKIAIGADHAGFQLKEHVKVLLSELRHNVIDLGTEGTEPVDYADFAVAVALAVRDGRATRGILVCGSGVGASIAANKIPEVRAGLCHDRYSAHEGVQHDDMNVLVMGGRVVDEKVAFELVRIFLESKFTGKELHEWRLGNVKTVPGRLQGQGEQNDFSIPA